MKLVIVLVWIALVVVVVLLFLDLVYFARGSLEEFPSPEDHAKMRTITGVLALPLAGGAVLLAAWLRRLVREGGSG